MRLLLLLLLVLLSGCTSNETISLTASTPYPTPTKEPLTTQTPTPRGLCAVPRKDVLLKAMDEGLNMGQVKEVAEYYDVVCNGKSPDKPTQIINSTEPKSGIIERDIFADQKQQDIADCQLKQSEYSSCLSKYNSELLEYQNCEMDTSRFKGLCFKPYNSCRKPYCN